MSDLDRPYGLADIFTGIFVAGSESGPVQIGWRKRPARVKDRLYHAWVADAGLARRVQLEACRLLDKAGKRIGETKTFDIPLEWAKKVLVFAAQQIGVPLYSDGDLVDYLNAQREREVQKLVRELGRVT